MVEQNNTTCSICGKGYYLCLACKSNQITPWKLHTDTSEHYKIFQVLRGYFLDVYTKEEAKEKLETLDLSDLNTFKEDVKSRIDEIINCKNDVDKNTLKIKYTKNKRATKSVETK